MKISEAQFPRVRILLSPAGQGTVTINDKEVPNVESVAVRSAAGKLSEVELNLIAVDIDITVEGDEEKPAPRFADFVQVCGCRLKPVALMSRREVYWKRMPCSEHFLDSLPTHPEAAES